MIANDTRSSKVTALARMHIKNVNFTMKNHNFDGMNAISIFYFLTCFANEMDRLNIYCKYLPNYWPRQWKRKSVQA